MIYLYIILGIILLIGIFIFANAVCNTKQMRLGAEKVVEELEKEYTLNEVDCSDFQGIKLYGIMKFDVKQYDIEGLGNLCLMCANGGVMQMLTAVITPVKKDMPLLSVDYMYMLGNRVSYVEVYDLPLKRDKSYESVMRSLGTVGKKFKALNDTIPEKSWLDELRPIGSYKKVKAKQDEQVMEMLTAYLKTYVSASAKVKLLSNQNVPKKAEKMEDYSHGLIENGGISTDAFKKALGEERTKKLFDYVMFGTQNYTK